MLKSDVNLVQDILSGIVVESWSDVQKIVRAGQASKYFSIGDQFVCGKTNPNGTVDKLVWDVIGIDHDVPSDPQFTHSMTLGLHDCYIALPFDAREALFAFPDGLAAGAYNFKIGVQPWCVDDVGKIITFTLTKDVPSGGQLVINNVYNATMIGATISSFASGADIIPIETVIMSEGNTGAYLYTVYAAVNDNANSIQCALLGSNDYFKSGIYQWLNSDHRNGWGWTAQTKFDRMPDNAIKTTGFLYSIDQEFLSVIGNVKKDTCNNGINETIEKIFLLSRSEIYGGDEETGGDGEPYEYYKSFSDLTEAGTNSDINRIKYYNNVGRYWTLRTAFNNTLYRVRGVNAEGRVSYGNAYSSNYIAPACCIV